MERKIVHVVGTGTIGEPLIGILCEQKSNLGIDEVTFHKQTPLTKDAPVSYTHLTLPTKA